jgi:hypothetical protein
VLARVRPFLQGEVRPGAVRVTGTRRVVVVRPGVFKADDDMVVGAAAAVSRMASSDPQRMGHLHTEEWARGFEFSRCFWCVGRVMGVSAFMRLAIFEPPSSQAVSTDTHGFVPLCRSVDRADAHHSAQEDVHEHLGASIVAQALDDGMCSVTRHAAQSPGHRLPRTHTCAHCDFIFLWGR